MRHISVLELANPEAPLIENIQILTSKAKKRFGKLKNIKYKSIK